MAQLYQEFLGDPSISKSYTLSDMTESLTFTDVAISVIPFGTGTVIRSPCIYTDGFFVAVINTRSALVIVITPLSVSSKTGFTAAGVRAVCISANCVRVARISTTLVLIIARFAIAVVSVQALTTVGSLVIDASRIWTALCLHVLALIYI